jgi:6-pyruvoyltetrahydropterin/6-carboxytetrahydropterin synthase
MYSLSVRDHFMVAHSFRGKIFGPAQNLHGATYVVDVIFKRLELDSHGLVVDIGLARNALTEVLNSFNYKNLDDETQFADINTTTEMLAAIIFDRMADKIRAGSLGVEAEELTALKVKLNESHVAWGSFESELRRP